MLFETYLHGFQYINPFHTGDRFNNVRNVFFGCCIIASCILFSYQVYLNVTGYLQFNVATAVSFQHFAYGAKTTAIDFPAITICPNNMFLADEVGFTPSNIAAFVLCDLATVNTIPFGLLDVSPQCKSNLPAMRPDMSAMGGLTLWADYSGAAYMLQQITQNSVNSVLGCKWQGKSINCADLFLNRMTDMGGCFTFYPSVEYVNSFLLFNSSLMAATETPEFLQMTEECWQQTYYPLAATNVSSNCTEYVELAFPRAQMQAFGTSEAQIGKYNLTTSAAGPRSGLQLILNVQPDQYCAGSMQQSLGFSALPHNRTTPPIIQIEPTIEIPAGFVSNIAISVKKIVRDTESIGKCSSNHPLQWYPAIPEYSYDACILQFIAEAMVTACDCVPYFSPPGMISSGYALNRFCNPDTSARGICYLDILHNRNYSAYNVPKGTTTLAEVLVVSGCPLQCKEIKYTTAVSFAPLSPAAFKMLIANQNVTIPQNLSEFRKSFAIANFYYEDVEVMLIHETQAVVIMDVMNGIGGSFGLCLGGSCITVLEVIFAIAKCCKKETVEAEEAVKRRVLVRSRGKSITPLADLA